MDTRGIQEEDALDWEGWRLGRVEIGNGKVAAAAKSLNIYELYIHKNSRVVRESNPH